MKGVFQMIEIHNPELEQRVREQIQRGQFHDVDELLERALDALQEKESAALPRRPVGRKSLAQLFADSPFKGLDIDFERDPDYGRDVTL
jgi:Arc/MetJ-type ribon-helix-helix transcriptional regulator